MGGIPASINAKYSHQFAQIFDEYREKVLDRQFYPKNPEETLKSRLTAVFLLGNGNFNEKYFAENFIKQTSHFHKEDFQRLSALSKRITYWESLNIIKTEKRGSHDTCEYKLLVLTDKGREIIHQDAAYTIDFDKCKFISQAAPKPEAHLTQFTVVSQQPVVNSTNSKIPIPRSKL